MKNVEEILNSAVEKLNNNNMDFSLLTEDEMDFFSFTVTYETLVNQLEEDKSVSTRVKCEGKMQWLKTTMIKKYPEYKEQIENYRK